MSPGQTKTMKGPSLREKVIFPGSESKMRAEEKEKQRMTSRLPSAIRVTAGGSLLV